MSEFFTEQKMTYQCQEAGITEIHGRLVFSHERENQLSNSINRDDQFPGGRL